MCQQAMLVEEAALRLDDLLGNEQTTLYETLFGNSICVISEAKQRN
jgi:hypothetical protein